MSTSRETPNPLRPYYRPPSIGIPVEVQAPTSLATHGLGPKNGSAASYASSARDMFSDIDYSDYLTDTSPSTIQSIKAQLDDWVYRYTSVLVAQPFDVAKTILQVQSQPIEEEMVPIVKNVWAQPAKSPISPSHDIYPSEDSDPDEPAYFTPAVPTTIPYSPTRTSRRQASERGYSASPSPLPKSRPPPPYQLVLKKSDSVLEVIAQEWSKEGGWGVWKASNTTFVYGFLLQTLEKWSRGVFSALLNVPDPGLEITAELAGTQYPWASLGVAVTAAVLSGVLLAPLDLIRTKLILTPTTSEKRSLTTQLRLLPSYLCPPVLILPTILHSLITPTISHSTPLFLRSHLSIDPVLTPGTFQLFKFLSRTTELFIKLPLETVLRRAQLSVLKLEIETTRAEGLWSPDLETVVKVGEYNGVVGTMWAIVREEGMREIPTIPVPGKTGKKVKSLTTTPPKMQKGQGLPGLWRGWRVGMWGLVGMWGSRAIGGGGGNGGEF